MEDPPKKFFRLAPGREVRLRYAFFITCQEVVKDPATGEIMELRCTYDPATRGGDSPDGRKVKATMHWVSAVHAREAEVRLYDTLFTKRDVGEIEEGADWKSNLNPKSLETLRGCRIEPSLSEAKPGERYQFERLGYFFTDPKDSSAGKPVFNRTVTLRDEWVRITRAGRENE
jgi:glutaminyl-tRNA synthetase